ncbi:hypothetical protein RB594_004742 [Gaeumannomyces avenae]
MAARKPVFNQHVLYDTTPLPDSIPKVKEIGASSAPLLSAAFFIGARCRDYNDDFMQCKNENPGTGEAKCLTEGRRVTRCARSVLEDINKSCLDEFRKHWQCLDNNNHQLWQCRADEWKLNKCVYDKTVRPARPSSTCWCGLLTWGLVGMLPRVWRRSSLTSPRTRPQSTSADSRYSYTTPSCQTRSPLPRKRRTPPPTHLRRRDWRYVCACRGEMSPERQVGHDVKPRSLYHCVVPPGDDACAMSPLRNSHLQRWGQWMSVVRVSRILPKKSNYRFDRTYGHQRGSRLHTALYIETRLESKMTRVTTTRKNYSSV